MILLNEINSRGFIYQTSEIEDLDKLMARKSICAYIGFDSTSDSLHIGSLVQLMLLHWLETYGHKPIALIGGGTTLVGDPSGKDHSRKILNQKDIEKNSSSFVSKILPGYTKVNMHFGLIDKPKRKELNWNGDKSLLKNPDKHIEDLFEKIDKSKRND